MTCSVSYSRYDVPMHLKPLIVAVIMMLTPTISSAKASLDAAEALIDQGKDLAAISMLEEVVDAAPDAYQAWFLLGVTQARKRHFDDAIRAFNRVVQLQPELAEPHNNLAVIYNEKGDLRAAVKELEASLKLNPSYVTAHENIGDLYVKLAAKSYKRALSRQENEALRKRYENLLRIRTSAADQAVRKSRVATKKKVAETVSDQSVKEAASSQALAAIEAWRVAWSARDLDSYFASYASDFNPRPRFATLEEWKRYKRIVIGKRKVINVTIDNIVVSKMADGQVKAVFLQKFRSDSFQSDNRKELILKKMDDGWKIRHEISN